MRDLVHRLRALAKRVSESIRASRDTLVEGIQNLDRHAR
jgi:hypothetical protein